MKKNALPFWQTFSSKAKHCKFHFEDGVVVTGTPHIFLIVSALTSSAGTSVDKENKEMHHAAAAPLLGDVIDSLRGWGESVELREKESSTIHRFERPHSLGSADPSNQREEPTSGDAIIYSMAVWLAANGVICPSKT